LFITNIIDKIFTGEVMKKITVISALWCPSCLILNKQLKKIKNLYTDLEINILDYDIDEEKIQKYNVGTILPVIIAGDNGSRLIGEKSDEELENFIESEVKDEF
jgi:thiol-disulfide isomerase/thioredoxin